MKLSKAKDDYIADTLSIGTKDKPKKFLSYIKSMRQDQVGVPPLRCDTGLKVDSYNEAKFLTLNSNEYLHRKMYHLFLTKALMVYQT